MPTDREAEAEVAAAAATTAWRRPHLLDRSLFLNPGEAAERLKSTLAPCSTRQLRRLRRTRKGPPYVRFGKTRVFYDREGLDRWVESLTEHHGSGTEGMINGTEDTIP